MPDNICVLTKTGVQIRDIFENFDASTSSEEVLSVKKIYAPEMRSDTGTFFLDDSVGISSNSAGIETQDLARGKNKNVVVSIYNPSGSSVPFYRELGPHIVKDVSLGESQTSGSFGTTIPVFDVDGRDGIHLELLTIKPAAAGVGTLSLFYGTTSAGTKLVSSMEFDIMEYQIGTEVTVPLKNKATLYNGENLFWEYVGPALFGEYVGNDFQPYSKAIEHEFVEKPLALDEDVTKHTDYISAYLSTDLVVPDTETQIPFDFVADNTNITMDGNGVLTISRDGVYGGDLRAFVVPNISPTVFFWIESRLDELQPWTPKNGAMVKKEYDSDSSDTVAIPACLTFQAGEQFRIMVKKGAGASTATFVGQSETLSGSTLEQKSATICFYRVGPI